MPGSSNSDLAAIIERAPIAICVIEGTTRTIELANAAFRALCAAENPIGLALTDVLPEFDRASAATLRNGNSVDCIHQTLDEDRTAIFAIDCTDRVRKAEELSALGRHVESLNDELDRFAYVTSHDLRAPLRGIGNLAHWIEEDLSGTASEETRQHLELLRGRVERLERLIDGILQYSRAGRPSDDVESVDVKQLLEELADVLRVPGGSTIEIATAMPVIDTERAPLAQVFQQLLNNGIHHGRKAGIARVVVSAEEQPTAWCFTVRDDGDGVNPRFHERIWGIFQSLSDERAEGTGIGLSLVRKIVEMRGGRAWLEPGPGAVFRFTWPLRAQVR